jgi:hypothetical protein
VIVSKYVSFSLGLDTPEGDVVDASGSTAATGAAATIGVLARVPSRFTKVECLALVRRLFLQPPTVGDVTAYGPACAHLLHTSDAYARITQHALRCVIIYAYIGWGPEELEAARRVRDSTKAVPSGEGSGRAFNHALVRLTRQLPNIDVCLGRPERSSERPLLQLLEMAEAAHELMPVRLSQRWHLHIGPLAPLVHKPPGLTLQAPIALHIDLEYARCCYARFIDWAPYYLFRIIAESRWASALTIDISPPVSKAGWHNVYREERHNSEDPEPIRHGPTRAHLQALVLNVKDGQRPGAGQWARALWRDLLTEHLALTAGNREAQDVARQEIDEADQEGPSARVATAGEMRLARHSEDEWGKDWGEQTITVVPRTTPCEGCGAGRSAAGR